MNEIKENITKDAQVQSLKINIKEEALNHYERININHKYAKLLVNGVRVGDTRYTNDKVENEKLYRVYDGEKFLGLGSKNDKGFKITKLLIT